MRGHGGISVNVIKKKKAISKFNIFYDAVSKYSKDISFTVSWV